MGSAETPERSSCEAQKLEQEAVLGVRQEEGGEYERLDGHELDQDVVSRA
jgi:hypothetical protein